MTNNSVLATSQQSRNNHLACGKNRTGRIFFSVKLQQTMSKTLYVSAMPVTAVVTATLFNSSFQNLAQHTRCLWVKWGRSYTLISFLSLEMPSYCQVWPSVHRWREEGIFQPLTNSKNLSLALRYHFMSLWSSSLSMWNIHWVHLISQSEQVCREFNDTLLKSLDALKKKKKKKA